jgi:hypothetical protein
MKENRTSIFMQKKSWSIKLKNRINILFIYTLCCLDFKKISEANIFKKIIVYYNIVQKNDNMNVKDRSIRIKTNIGQPSSNHIFELKRRS